MFYYTFVYIVQYSQHDVPLDNKMVPKKAANLYCMKCVARKSAFRVSVEVRKKQGYTITKDTFRLRVSD